MELHDITVDVKMDSRLHDGNVNVIHNIKMDNLHDPNIAHIKMDGHMHESNITHIKMDNHLHDGNLGQIKMDSHLHDVPVTHIQIPLNQTAQHSNLPQQVEHIAHKIEQPVTDAKPRIEKKKKEAIDGQAREIIYKVIKFFESEKLNRGYAFPVENVVKRACAATGLSESTIKRIKREGLRAEATQTKMAGPKKKRVRKTKVQLDYFQLCALRGIVNSYSMRKEVPTLGKILAAAKHELNYRGGKESLRLILLNKLGIKFKKCEKKNKKPPEPTPPPVQQVTNVMTHIPMQQMKPENQCIYTNMMPQVPPVSY